MKTIVAVGDIMPGGKLSTWLIDKEVQQAREELADLLGTADIIIGNLECPITDHGTPRPGELSNLKMPTRLAPLLGVFDGVSLANNHILDFGAKGLNQTTECLRQSGIEHCGAGQNEAEAAEPIIFDVDGFLIAVTAFTDKNWYPAGPSIPGTNVWREPVSFNAIQDLSKRTDFVVVMSHQGYEFVDYPGPEEIAFAQRAVDAGADLVLGHHSHTTMGMTLKGKSVIAYGLGNFIAGFNSYKFPEKTKPGLIYTFSIDRHEVKKVNVTPVVSNTHGWPVAPDEKEAQRIRHHFHEISDVLDDKEETIRRFREQASENMLPHALTMLMELYKKEGCGAVWDRLKRIRRVDVAVLASRVFHRRKK